MADKKIKVLAEEKLKARENIFFRDFSFIFKLLIVFSLMIIGLYLLEGNLNINNNKINKCFENIARDYCLSNGKYFLEDKSKIEYVDDVLITDKQFICYSQKEETSRISLSNNIKYFAYYY